MKRFVKPLGSKVRFARVSMRLSLLTLSKSTGISVAVLKEIETHVTFPSREQVMVLEHALVVCLLPDSFMVINGFGCLQMRYLDCVN